MVLASLSVMNSVTKTSANTSCVEMLQSFETEHWQGIGCTLKSKRNPNSGWLFNKILVEHVSKPLKDRFQQNNK